MMLMIVKSGSLSFAINEQLELSFQRVTQLSFHSAIKVEIYLFELVSIVTNPVKPSEPEL